MCYRPFVAGDRLISCPRCGSLHHASCWFRLSVCSCEGCGYPVQDTMRRILGSRVHFEELTAGSEPVVQHMKCPAGNERDRFPFQAGEDVLYCPGCEAPFHVKCWLTLDYCPSCKFDIRSMIDQFIPAEDRPDSILQENG